MSTESVQTVPLSVRGATWCPCDRARADLHPRGLACAFDNPLCTRTQLGTDRPCTRGDDTSTQGVPQLTAAAAGESSMSVQPRLAACGPARLAPTTTRHASSHAATVEEGDVDLDLRVASRSAVALLAEELPSRRKVLALDVEDGRKRLLVGKVGVEGAAPSRTGSRARAAGGRDQPLQEESPILHCEVHAATNPALCGFRRPFSDGTGCEFG